MNQCLPLWEFTKTLPNDQPIVFVVGAMAHGKVLLLIFKKERGEREREREIETTDTREQCRFFFLMTFYFVWLHGVRWKWTMWSAPLLSQSILCQLLLHVARFVMRLR